MTIFEIELCHLKLYRIKHEYFGFWIGGIAALYLFVKHAWCFAEVAAGFIPANVDEMAVGGNKPRRYTLFI